MHQIDLKIIALRRPVWGIGEVRSFLQCSKSKAYRLISECQEHYGGSAAETRRVYRDRFLEMCGTDFEKEIKNAYIEKEAISNAKIGIELHTKGL